MASPLNADQIAELLKTPQRQTRSSAPKSTITPHARPIQLGPLGWRNEPERCVSRGCGASTLTKVNGITYCGTHALYKLNEMLIPLEYNLQDCDCNAGRHSMGNIHTEGCPLYDQVKDNERNNTSP